MGVYTIGMIAHSGAGKTSLAEAILHRAGAVKRLGSVDAGTSALDYEPDEKERKSSTHSAVGHFTWRDHSVDLIDVPGSMNFVGATVAAVRVADGALMMASAEPGIQGESEFLWEFLERRGTPRLMVICKLDREQANFDARLAALNEAFGNRFVPVTVPLGHGEHLQGVVDLIEMKAYDYANADKPKVVDLPADLRGRAEEYRYRLVESAAEADDELLEKYLESESLEPDEIERGLRAGTSAGGLVPVFAASGTRNIGIDRILDALVNLLPDADARRAQLRGLEEAPDGYVPDSFENDDFAALVFSTKVDQYSGKLSIVKVMSGELHAADEIHNPATGDSERPAHIYRLVGKEQTEVKVLQAGEVGALPKLAATRTGHTLCATNHKVEFAPIAFPEPVLTYALQLSGKGEEEKLGTALRRMMEEDPTLSFKHNAETGDTLVAGMGQIHLEMVKERLKREFNITSRYEKPHVPYRETIRVSAKAQGKYKKQTGGRGQYGDCWLEIKPNGQEEQMAFKSAIVGGVIPRNYIPAVEKGVADALSKGIVAGFPVIGIAVTVYDGSYHDVDSSEMAFKIAGSMAFKKAMEQAKPVLLEPVMKMEIIVPADYMGDVMGDINSRRGKVLGMDSRGRNQVVRAEVPMGEALSYATELRSMTSGQGYFTQNFSHYDEVPLQLAGKVMKKRREEQEA
ncbi:MAG: elongation factor G [SAR324 cluster bacterium]|nr:elongation factor G [SAR324 cluster bacterium]